MYWQVRFHHTTSSTAPGNRIRSLRCTALSKADLGASDYLSSPFQTVELIQSHRPIADDSPANSLAVDCQPLLQHRRRRDQPLPTSAVTLITACDLAPDKHTAFLDQFQSAADFMVRQPAHLRYCLFRSLADDSPFTFINLAIWQSIESFVKVFQSDAFKALIRGGFQPNSQIVVTHPPTWRNA